MIKFFNFQAVIAVCAMERKAESKPMQEILARMQDIYGVSSLQFFYKKFEGLENSCPIYEFFRPVCSTDYDIHIFIIKCNSTKFYLHGLLLK